MTTIPQISRNNSQFCVVNGPKAMLFTDAQVAGTYIMREGSTAPLITTNLNTAGGGAYLDPALFGSTYRLQATTITNGTAWSTVTMTFGLHLFSASSGGADDIDVTVGSAVSGSTVAVTDQTANTIATATSGNFAAPAAGVYGLGIVLSANITADNDTWVIVSLLARP